MVRCPNCGCVQVRELPAVAEIEAFYGTAYLDKYTAGMSQERFCREMPARHHAKLGLVRRVAGVGRLLDVGCGEGLFLEQASRVGFDCWGCDYGLRSAYPDGVRVRTGTLDAENGLPFPDNHFDVVTCWAVIEHVRLPHLAVREMCRVLRPGGFLFCDTPLCNDLCERLVSARSHWFCPPEHLHVFGARGLRVLLEEGGFCIVRHSPFFERSRARWMARRGRNLAVGALLGGSLRLFAPQWWRKARQVRCTQIGDIQLIVAIKDEGKNA